MKTASVILPLLLIAGIGALWADDVKKEHAQMKKEHKQVHDEHDGWLKQIGTWRIEHRRALATLHEIESQILEHEASLEELAEHAREHEDHIRHHDEEISDHEGGGEGKAHAELLKQHTQLVEEHAQMKKLLTDFHDHHDALMAALKDLREMLSKTAN